MSGLEEAVLKGDIRAASRLMRQIDDGAAGATDTLKKLFPHTGRAYVIGITGAPGSGKSTLTDRLIAHYRKEGRSVGVIAVDPTSPFTGGAILGDRIRMQGHATDPGVFIRSLATRGNLGGLSRATGDCLKVMDAMGREVIIVETVGVGQDEIDIAQLAHTTCVVLVPGLGDDIQAIKAGILEIADVFVVNKSDLDGSDRVVRELRSMLELRHAVKAPRMDHDAAHRMKGGALGTPSASGSGPRPEQRPKTPDSATPAQEADARASASGSGPRPEQRPKTPDSTAPAQEDEWEPPIVKTVAARDQGLADLAKEVAKHRTWLESTGKKQERERQRAATQLVSLLRDRLLAAGLARLEREKGNLSDVAAQIAKLELDPYTLADQLAGDSK